MHVTELQRTCREHADLRAVKVAVRAKNLARQIDHVLLLILLDEVAKTHALREGLPATGSTCEYTQAAFCFDNLKMYLQENKEKYTAQYIIFVYYVTRREQVHSGMEMRLPSMLLISGMIARKPNFDRCGDDRTENETIPKRFQ